MDINMRPRPLRVPQDPLDSHLMQPAFSRYGGGGNGTGATWEENMSMASFSVPGQTFEDCSPASLDQDMTSFGFSSTMDIDCFSPNGQASSYPTLHDIPYGSTWYPQASSIDQIHNTGFAISPQSTMSQPSPLSPGSQIFSGQEYSPVSPFSNHSSQLPGSASGDVYQPSSFNGMEQPFDANNHYSHVGSDWGRHPQCLYTCHEAPQPEIANSGDGAKQQASDNSIRCPDCKWAPQPYPKRTEKQIRQSVSKHRNRRHSNITHTCPVPKCGTTFTRVDNIKPHLEKKHKYERIPGTPRRSGAGSRRSLGTHRASKSAN